MLRFLSNYLFQNENAEPNEDPTATINQNPLNDKDKTSSSQSQNPEETDDLQGPTPKPMEEGDDDDDEDQDDVDDWVLIGDGDKKNEEQVANGNSSQLTLREVELVAPNDEQDDQDEGCEEEDEEGAKEEVGEGGLLWENKLIEHPSMSVYIDLATSLTNGATSCMSISSIAAATSPGESVIVLEHDDGDDDDDDDMDILETIEMVQLPQSGSLSVPKKSQPAPIPPPQPIIQNGRRKKGHYPCSSSNAGNMPRRHGVRNSGARQAFQMISSSSTTGDLSEEERNRPLNNSANPNQNQSNKKKRGNANATSSSSTATDSPTTACGIAIVGTPPGGPTSALGHHSSNMLNKNLKLLDLFPARSSYSRKAEAQKIFSTPRGHHLQEGRRRSDLQNYMRHSHANNDRRSAQQRRVQKVGGGENGGRK